MPPIHPAIIQPDSVMKTMLRLLPALALLGGAAVSAQTPAAKSGSWITLFDGKSLDGWTNRDGGPAKWEVTDGTMTGKQGSGDVWTKARFGDFVLELEFKTTGNSGVFFRTDDPKDPVQTGIEIQVDNPREPDRHSVGAIYDLVAPTKNAAKANEWNRLEVAVKGAKISVRLNGEKIAEMDLDKWTEAGKNPDGSPNKFKRALKDWKREGHIGFQDHGSNVSYRKVRIRSL